MTIKYWFIGRSNETIKLTEDIGLEQLDIEINGNQLKYLHKAIESLSNKKYVEDKFSFPIDNLESKYQVYFRWEVNSWRRNQISSSIAR